MKKHILILLVFVLFLTGCGISKDQFEIYSFKTPGITISNEIVQKAVIAEPQAFYLDKQEASISGGLERIVNSGKYNVIEVQTGFTFIRGPNQKGELVSIPFMTLGQVIYADSTTGQGNKIRLKIIREQDTGNTFSKLQKSLGKRYISSSSVFDNGTPVLTQVFFRDK